MKDCKAGDWLELDGDIMIVKSTIYKYKLLRKIYYINIEELEVLNQSYHNMVLHYQTLNKIKKLKGWEIIKYKLENNL